MMPLRYIFACLLAATSITRCLADTPAPSLKPLTDPQVDVQVTQLLKKMTATEKLLQLLSYCPNGVARLGIPNLQAGEALHGVVADGATSFPQSIALGATWDPGLVEQIGAVIGQEARAVGVHQIFAPMLGLARDPRWGRVEESYGEDPYLVAQIGVAYINGVQGKGTERFGLDKVIATPKHFLADGEPWGGHNGEAFETSERVLRDVYMPPFEAAVKQAHAGSLMPAHHPINGIPCHANPWLLNTVLRKEWGFDGFVTSDMGDIPKLAGGHQFAHNGEKNASVLALTAGVDMELSSGAPQNHVYLKELAAAIKNGVITRTDIDRAVRRVLRAKIQLLGLSAANPQAAAAPNAPTNDPVLNYTGTEDIWAKLIAEGKFTTPTSGRRTNYQAILSNPAHDQLSLRAAQESIVLLKNENNLLPLDKMRLKKILVVGPLATMQNTGGYSGGTSHPYINVVKGLKTVLGAGASVVYDAGCQLSDETDTQLPAAVADAQTADAIIVVVGHSRAQVGENLDRDDLNLIGGQQKMVEAMSASGKPVVVVLENGAPLTINWIQDHVPAVIESWYGGQNAGLAIAQAILGDINPGGKMPVSVPKNLGQIPCYYDHLPITGPSDYYQSHWANLYVFGQGMSYTTFAYSGLSITPAQITLRQTATVRAAVTNTGQRVGDEVVQLYVHQGFTSLEQPVEALKGFQRITLQPGEQKVVTFTLGFDQLKFWKDQGWVMEPGQVNIMLGSSSKDIRQSGVLEIAAR